MPESRPSELCHATAFIDRAALVANVQRTRSLAPGAAVLCMVKANAYGHGMLEVAQTLAPHCEYLGVARMSEALALRRSGVESRIVLFSQHLTRQDFKQAAAFNITPTLFTEAQLDEALAECAKAQLRYWLKIDSGMHRLGLSYRSLKLKQALDPALCETVMTHLHSADDDSLQASVQQVQLFAEALQGAGFDCARRNISVANSALLLQQAGANASTNVTQKNSGYTDWMCEQILNYNPACDIVRPGIMLYGADPLTPGRLPPAYLQAAMTLAAPVIHLCELAVGASVGYGASWRAQRPSWIATVAAGYGDGYPRHAPHGTPVLINGQRCALAGRVSMDTIGVDVTDAIMAGHTVQPGDSAVLWGPELPVEEIAAAADTISYQLLTGVTGRVERIYR
ncbi:MAG: alanine racemase [Pseudomonadales bacterium]